MISWCDVDHSVPDNIQNIRCTSLSKYQDVYYFVGTQNSLFCSIKMLHVSSGTLPLYHIYFSEILIAFCYADPNPNANAK